MIFWVNRHKNDGFSFFVTLRWLRKNAPSAKVVFQIAANSHSSNGLAAHFHKAMKTISESDKLSLAACKKMLNVNGAHYTDEQILKIRTWIYNMAEYTAEFLQDRQTKNKTMKHNNID